MGSCDVFHFFNIIIFHMDGIARNQEDLTAIYAKGDRVKDYVVLSLETYDKLRKESDIYHSIDAYAQNNNMRAATVVEAHRKLEREVRILRTSASEPTEEEHDV